MEFVKYFWELYNYGYDTGHSAPLDQISLDDCLFCSSAVESIQELQDSHAQASGGAVTVLTAVAAPGRPETGLMVNTLIRQEASTLVEVDGRVSKESSRLASVRADAAVVWDGQWSMGAMDIIEEAAPAGSSS